MKKALIIGINDYPQSPLKGCVNDANVLGSLVESNGDGSPNFGIRKLTSPGDSITRTVLRQTIEELFSGDSEIALFFFSGHGFIKSTGGYLVTTDAKKYDEGIPMDELLKIANSSKARNKIIILDCCFSGAMGVPNIAESNITQLSEGLSILTACSECGSAMEVNGKGVFTSLLTDALKGGRQIFGGILPLVPFMHMLMRR